MHNYISNDSSCLSCQSSSIPNSSNTQVRTSSVYNEGGCTKEFIDSGLLKYKFGLSYCEGHGTQRWIPSWLLNSDISDTPEGDIGIPDPCVDNMYYQIKGGLVYAVTVDKDKFGRFKEIERIYLKPALIQNSLIQSLDANKIINRSNFFKNTSLVKPFGNYQTQDITDANPILNSNYKVLDIAVTDNAELKAMWQPKFAKDAVLPSLAGILSYDPVTNIVTDLISPKLKALEDRIATLETYNINHP
jgi:hypothetical protein